MGSTTKLIPYPEDADALAAGAQAIMALANDLDFTKIPLLTTATITNASLIDAYPLGMSMITVSTSAAGSGGWPWNAWSQVVTVKTANDRAAQWQIAGAQASTVIYFRNLNAGVNGPWVLMSGADTGWKAITGLSGWSVSGGIGWQARQIGNQVHLRGGMNNVNFSGGYTTIGQMPTGIANPPSTQVFPGINNTTIIRAFLVNTSGNVQVYSSAASASGIYISGANYRID